MKHVFPNHSNVLHLWANQSQGDARCKNVFFNGKSCYSYGYHYELGRIVEYNNQKLFLINDSGYSKTTEKHIWSAWHACENSLRLKTNDFNILNSLLRQQDKLLIELFGHFSKRKTYWRKVYETKSQWSIGYQIAEFNNLCEKLGHKDLCLIVDDDFKKLYAAHCKLVKKRETELKSPEAIAKQAIERQKREDREKLKIIDKINQWRNGGPSCKEIENLNRPILRVKNDNVETSRHASVPLSHALRLLRLIETDKVQSGERIGHFTYSSINNGIIHIGCHSIELSEAQKVLNPYKTKLEVVS